MTRQLLAYAGKGRFAMEALNVSRIVRDMTDLLRTSIPKRVHLKPKLKPSLPGIEADRGQLQVWQAIRKPRMLWKNSGR